MRACINACFQTDFLKGTAHTSTFAFLPFSVPDHACVLSPFLTSVCWFSPKICCLVSVSHLVSNDSSDVKSASFFDNAWGGRSHEVFCFLSSVIIEGSNTQGKSLRKNLYQAYDVQAFLRVVDLLACQKWHACISFPLKKKCIYSRTHLALWQIWDTLINKVGRRAHLPCQNLFSCFWVLFLAAQAALGSSLERSEMARPQLKLWQKIKVNSNWLVIFLWMPPLLIGALTSPQAHFQWGDSEKQCKKPTHQWPLNDIRSNTCPMAAFSGF